MHLPPSTPAQACRQSNNISKRKAHSQPQEVIGDTQAATASSPKVHNSLDICSVHRAYLMVAEQL